MNARAFEQLALENSLRRALEREEFILHYQPFIDIQTGRILGTEALIRWASPTGTYGPDSFIPIAEDTGLIVPIGEWVLRTACTQNRNWQQTGLPQVPVAVNLSARQFQQENLIESIARILAETELDSRFLLIELTESTIMKNAELAIESLKELKAMGIQIAIDDFGTGYSSLSYLKRFPIDALKIDKSFVHDCIDNADDAAIVTAIISMAHSLKVKVIAEGVETERQQEFLKTLNCDRMQGYLFSRPVTPEAISSMLTHRKKTKYAK
jgi:EAL domain-containing protein (putative c-di-GMP-specific phosphodiesterase class I)